MYIILNRFESVCFDSLLGVGCGNGRFFRVLAGEHPDINTLGIGHAKQSVEMPREMSSYLGYEVVDFLGKDLYWRSDTVTAIEVPEYIPPGRMHAFISQMATVIEGGRMAITVPHENKQIRDKYYQDFSEAGLAELLIPWFDPVVILNRQLKLLIALELAVSGRDNHVEVMNSLLFLNTLWGLCNQRYLYAPSESQCRRIVAVCEK
jgi:hypothetical protein